MKIRIISDTHFGHDKLHNDFGCPPDVDSRMLRGLSVCKRQDILIHLGDVAFGREDYWHRLLRQTLPCKMYLVRGNHDKRSITWYLQRGWDAVFDALRLHRYGCDILLSHKPLSYPCGLNIHGHFHNSNWRVKDPELVAVIRDRHRLVAMEYQDYSPVTLKKLVQKGVPTLKRGV